MTDGQNRRMKGGAVESVGNILILVSVATGFVSFVALFKPFPQESFFTRKRVVVVWLASLALFALGGLLLPVPTLGPFFMLVSILAGTCSFIALFQPLPQIWLPTRKRAAVVWLASFALLFLGASLAPEPTPEARQERAPSSSQPSDSTAPASSSTFIERLNAGAGCAELFRLRNSIDPGSSAQVRMNEDLRRIGCYSAGSTRNP